jgi:hypothetical protein
VRSLRIALAAVVLVSCGADSDHPSPSASTVAQPSAASVRLTADDERCARDTFGTFITAVNKGNRSLLTPLLSGAFMWVTFPGSTTHDARDAVERLLMVSASGEQWDLRHLDVNGRGWHGGIDFGVVIRRTGTSAPTPHRDFAGKGVIDCPAGKIQLFGLGDSA